MSKRQETKGENVFIPLWPDFGKSCGLGRDATYNAAKRGEIPAIKIGDLWKVPKQAGNEFLKTGINPLRAMAG